ncbi:tetratricopeptide repeat-containing sensor histidine kinase [Flavobacterium sp. J27]|uniref:tetratricopeptide repeat-containing sensor histidine kinase n=1 Tax=Flavobacterium sp. J27 TaxID=2060419 RepID=UPI00103006BD|nr:tetratricopeptide repeat-containing sensor histidine kinase [Flavobacterium sp. J27]
MKFFDKSIIILMFLTFSAFCQNSIENDLFEKNIKIKTQNWLNKPHFQKASFFFLEKNWDSTLVYSMKQLSESKKKLELNNYCHFFRGFSFKQKKLFLESQKELDSVTEDFDFYNRVVMLLGETTLELKDFEKALSYFKQLENVVNLDFFGIKKSTVEHNLGICYIHIKDFEKAEYYLLQSAKKQEEDKDTLLLVGSYGDIANLYYEQYKDDLAIPYFIKAYELAKNTKDYKLKFHTANNMAVVEENRKDFLKALQYRKELEKWKDSLNDQNKIWEVAQLEKQFAVKEKQKEVSFLQVENKVKIAERNGLFYSAIVLLLLLGTTIYFYKEKIKTNKIILAQKEALNELNATKDKLFSIVSHDLRSSVNMMKVSNAKLLENLATKNLEELDVLLHQNNQIANSTYNLLDNLLHWALLQTKQSYFEITSQRLYFLVEQVAYNYLPLMHDKKLQFENTVNKKEIIFVDQESLKLLLRNFLDNAIKFSNENGFIKVFSESVDDSYCRLIIEDNGLGMSEITRQSLLKETTLLAKKENEKIIGSGLGLQLCKSIIKKNNGKLDIQSELGKGTKIIVSLPKKHLHG